MTKSFLFFLSFISMSLISRAQVLQNKIFNPNIRSVMMHLQAQVDSRSFFELNSTQKIVFSFDELGYDYRNYQFKITHCNADWTQSSLLPMEYLEGYPEDYVNHSQTSFNTYTDYIHYEIYLPTENTRIKKSGNYLITVFEVGQSDNPSIQYRFVVYENLARVKAMVKRSDVVSERDNWQEIDFSFIAPFTLSNPFTDIKASILQNNRWDHAISGLKPNFQRENEIIFNYDKEASFAAGNEYRLLDLSTLRRQTERMGRIQIVDGLAYVDVIPDMTRKNLPYAMYRDLNGLFVLANQDGTGSAETDADYVQVKFTLSAEPVSIGSVYIMGDGIGPFSDRTQLKYNYTRKAYELNTLLKQGIYSYQYAIMKNAGKGEAADLEGNFFQTENNYTILIYYRDFSDDYDRVIGCYTANSQRGY